MTSFETPEFPSPKLKPLLQDLQGTCWWCGDIADSLEHRHKRTDLQRLFNQGAPPIWVGDEGPQTTIRGANSKQTTVRFGRILCANCNNRCSQPFDEAYDRYSNYLFANMDRWWQSCGLNLVNIYGADWQEQALNLARYYVKNFGCQLANKGVPPPDQMKAFLNGDRHAQDIGLYLVKSEAHHIAHRALARKFGPNASIFRLPDDVHLTPEQDRIIGYDGIALIGYVGARFMWREGSGNHDSFFHHQHPVLNPMNITRADRRALHRRARQGWSSYPRSKNSDTGSDK